MRTTKDNLAKFIVGETDTKNFIANEKYKSQDFVLGMEYVLASLEKIFEVSVEDEARVDLEKAKYEILEASGELDA